MLKTSSKNQLGNSLRQSGVCGRVADRLGDPLMWGFLVKTRQQKCNIIKGDLPTPGRNGLLEPHWDSQLDFQQGKPWLNQCLLGWDFLGKTRERQIDTSPNQEVTNQLKKLRKPAGIALQAFSLWMIFPWTSGFPSPMQTFLYHEINNTTPVGDGLPSSCFKGQSVFTLQLLCGSFPCHS